MATSGTYAFSVSANDVINAAFRKLQVFGPYDAGPQAVDITNALFGLELIVKAMGNKPTPLWCVQEMAIPMLAGVNSYTIGLPPGAPRPLDLKFAFLRNSTGNDVEISIVSRYDYDRLGSKSSTGVVNQLYYDPQIGNTVAPPGAGVITVYDTPSDSTYTLHLVIRRSLQDVGLTTNNLDFPQEAYQLLVYALADYLALDYMCRQDIRAEVAGRAKVCEVEFFDTMQEQTSVYFTPSERSFR